MMSLAVEVEERFGTYLMNFIRKRISNVEDAKDIYQEVLLKIIAKSGSLISEERLQSWLFTIARNSIVDYYRSRRVSYDLEVVTEEKYGPTDNVEKYGELESCLQGFIRQLPNEYRELIVKSEIEGISQKELAATFNMNYVTLRSKVQRGRDRIRKMIDESCSIEQDSSGGPLDCAPKARITAECGSTSACGCNEN